MNEFDRFFAAQYDTYTLDLDFWKAHAGTEDGPRLELGCGAGRVLIPLAEAGYAITGLDNDPTMLQRLSASISERTAARVTLVEAEIEKFELTDRFTLVFSPCNTFSYLPQDSAQQALHTIRRHLFPSGLLVLDLPNPGFLLKAPIDPHEPVDSFFEPEKGLPVQVYADQDIHPGGGRVDVTWHYDELHPDGFVRRFDYPITYYMRKPDLLTSMLEEAGYTRIRFQGGYNNQELTDKSHRLIASARSGD